MGDGQWEMEDWHVEMGDGCWEMSDGRWAMGDGHWLERGLSSPFHCFGFLSSVQERMFQSFVKCLF